MDSLKALSDTGALSLCLQSAGGVREASHASQSRDMRPFQRCRLGISRARAYVLPTLCTTTQYEYCRRILQRIASQGASCSDVLWAASSGPAEQRLAWVSSFWSSASCSPKVDSCAHLHVASSCRTNKHPCSLPGKVCKPADSRSLAARH